MKTRLLVDNNSETKFIDKFFERTNKLSIFKLEKYINLMLRNSEMIQKLTKKTFVNIIIRDYSKQIFCYLAKLDVYTVILDNEWL